MNYKILVIFAIAAILSLGIYMSTFAVNAFAATDGNSKFKAIVTLNAKEGKKQDLLNALVPYAEQAKKRIGNILFDLYASTKNPNELIIDQLWSNKTAFDNSYNSTQAIKFRDSVSNLLATVPAQVNTYTELNKTRS